MTIETEMIIQAYSEEKWGDLPNFTGGLINYGYWKNIIPRDYSGVITEKMRTESSYALYDILFESLPIKNDNILLEIGYGKGYGTLHIAKEKKPKKIVGLDVTWEQVVYANAMIAEHKEQEKIIFTQGNIVDYDFKDLKFDMAYSVEVFQHIDKTYDAFYNIKKSLNSNGILAITTFFLKDTITQSAIDNNFPLVRTGQESLKTINEIKNDLLMAGFNHVSIENIGAYVFYGYEKWISQQRVKTPCSHAYYKAFMDQLIDYYTIYAYN